MDLPNEMIYNIWNKLNKIDVLYSFMGVNKRFNKLVCNMTYTRSIELVESNNHPNNCSLTYPILDRFCLNILPQIHELVECLTFESISMDRILSAGHYPRLQKLTVMKVEPEFVIRHFIDESPFVQIFKQQITYLTLSINDPEKTQSLIDLSTTVFAPIFSMFKSLIELDFGSPGDRRYPARLKIADLPSTICFSSSIVHLRISVDTFDDCLCLLDGRLTYLHRLVIQISNICTTKLIPSDMVINTIRSFSLTSHSETKEYDSEVISLLRRMIYLEDLMLRLTVGNRSAFIDNTHLNNEILLYLPRRQTLTFNIMTYTTVINETNWMKLDNIQHTFYNGKSHQCICYIDQYPRGKARSHIYSISYTLNDLYTISSSFPGGLFMHIVELKKEKEVLEKELDKALEKGENAKNNEEAAMQNKIADSIEVDIKDLNKEIKEAEEKADIKPTELESNNKKLKY
ncbi:hypothetical protein I4U23_026589 [Adineta vaga]|nr:hypothetical protein I4U23_026589 [Adineta vaga]